MNKLPDPFLELKLIIAKLRDPNGGCPWDLEQTHSTLKPYLIEEAYEALEAIDQSPKELCEELGDLLLQIYLHSQIASDQGEFTIEDVFRGISAKLITRHPHVFGDVRVSGSSDVLKNWEQIKKSEKPHKKSALDGVPKQLPALLKAQRLGEKAARVGFDWPSAKDVKAKVKEELLEFLEAKPDTAAEEFGDILFSLVQLGRKLGFDLESILQTSNAKFTSRFQRMESELGGKLAGQSLELLESKWQKIKTNF